MRRGFTLPSFVLVGLYAAGQYCLASDEPVYLLPKDRATYFRGDHITASIYVVFESNGTYLIVDREHMYVAESDRGTWQQAADGLVTLQSARWVGGVEYGTLSISDIPLAEGLPRLTAIQEALGSFLQTHDEDGFSRETIEHIWQRSVGVGNIVIEEIHVDPGVLEVERSDLVGLQRAVAAYVNAGAGGSVFQATPYVRQSETVLLWRGRRRSSGGYVLIDRKTFEEETTTTQPFLFFPELNEPKRQDGRSQ